MRWTDGCRSCRYGFLTVPEGKKIFGTNLSAAWLVLARSSGMPTTRAKPYSLYGGCEDTRPSIGEPPVEVQEAYDSRLRRGNRVRKSKERSHRKRDGSHIEHSNALLAGGRGRRSKAGLRVEDQSTLLHPCVAAVQGLGTSLDVTEVLSKLRGFKAPAAGRAKGRARAIVRL